MKKRIKNNFIEWNESISIGVEDIDKQHRELVNIINKLYSAIANRTIESEGPIIMQQLRMYTISHFAVEESLMRIFKYEDYEHHLQQHQALVAQLEEVILRLETGEHHINSDLLIYLRKWLLNHILKTDSRLGVFLVKKGIGATTPWYKKIFLFFKG